MSSLKTLFLNMHKWIGNDFAKRDELVENFDKIDLTLKNNDTTLQSHTASLADIAMNVKAFNAKGDGATDDTQSFINAINYIKNNGLRTLLIPKGIYIITQTLTIDSSIKIIGDGKGISILNFQNVINAIEIGSSNVQIIGAGNTYNQNSNTFNLVSGTVNVDDYIIIAGKSTDNIYVADVAGDYKKAIVKQIKSVTGANITTKSINQLPNISEFDIKSFNQLIGMEISDISIYLNYGTNGNGLLLKGLKDFKLNNIEVVDLTKLGARGITVMYSVNGLIENCTIKGFSDQANSYALGYGISINQCVYNVDIINCDISKCKHVVALDGREISQEKIRILNNKFYDGVYTSFAMDTHTLCYDIEYSNNNIFNYYGGFICRGIKLKFSNNDIDIYGKLCSVEQYALDCICQDNKINAPTIGYSDISASIQFINNTIEVLSNGFVISNNIVPIKITFRGNKIDNVQKLIRLSRNDIDISNVIVHLNFTNNFIRFSNQLISSTSSETKAILKEMYIINNIFKEIISSNTTTFMEYYNNIVFDIFYSMGNIWDSINSLISTNNRTWFPPLTKDILNANLGKIGWDGASNISSSDYTINNSEWLDTTLNKTLRYNGSWNDESGITSRGTTAQRPASPYNGFKYFDTTVNGVRTWNGSAWV